MLNTDIAKLRRQEQTDYLFLARRERCWLFDVPSVFERGGYANLCWLAYEGRGGWPVICLYLHVSKSVEGRPWGSVTLLDYQTTAQDVAAGSELPRSQREKFIKAILKRYTHNAPYCSMLETIQYLKTGEVK